MGTLIAADLRSSTAMAPSVKISADQCSSVFLAEDFEREE